MNLDLIEEESELIIEKTKNKFYCTFKNEKEQIEVSNFEDAVIITLARFSEVRNENIAKVRIEKDLKDYLKVW